jgi:hypothetical protein
LIVWIDATVQPVAVRAKQGSDAILRDGNALPHVYDASGNSRDFKKTTPDSQHRFRQLESYAFLHSDRHDDSLSILQTSRAVRDFKRGTRTISITDDVWLAGPGGFRALS